MLQPAVQVGVSYRKEAMAGRELLSSSLRYLLEEKGMPEAVQDALGANGYTTFALFTLLEDTRAGLRTVLYNEFNLKTDERANDRVIQAMVIDAWESSTKRSEKEKEEESIAKAARLPWTLVENDLFAMRNSFEFRCFKIEDKVAPSDSLIEMRTEMIEDNVLKAESLKRATTKEDVEEEKLGLQLENNGTVRVRKRRRDRHVEGLGVATAQDLYMGLLVDLS